MPNRLFHLGNKREWIAPFGPNHDEGIAPPLFLLLHHRRVDGRTFIFIKTKILRIANHSDNGHPIWSLLTRVAHLLSDGIFTRKELARHTVVDDRNGRSALAIGVGENAPCQNGNLHRLEIVRSDEIRCRFRLASLRRTGSSVNEEVVCNEVTAQWQLGNEAD